MVPILDHFDKFFQSTHTNLWIGSLDCLHVYVRKSNRYFNHKYINVVDIANISTIHPDFEGKGYFKAFMLHVERHGLPVFVESIHNPLLITMLSKHGYQNVPNNYDIHMIKFPVDK